MSKNILRLRSNRTWTISNGVSAHLDETGYASFSGTSNPTPTSYATVILGTFWASPEITYVVSGGYRGTYGSQNDPEIPLYLDGEYDSSHGIFYDPTFLRGASGRIFVTAAIRGGSRTFNPDVKIYPMVRYATESEIASGVAQDVPWELYESESGKVEVGRRSVNLDHSPAMSGYTAVRIIAEVDDNGNQLVYEAGDTSGMTLEIENPFGTQAMANNILASVQGYEYQPIEANGALLDPAAELGDGITVNGLYSGIYVRATQFGRLMSSDVAAPADSEEVHEYSIKSPSERKFERFQATTKASLKVNATAITAEVTARQSSDSALSTRITQNATAITAKVSKNSPSGQTSFGWALSDSEWRVFNQSGNILRATSAGLEVKGKIQADEGYIGGENGFVIKSSAIYNGITTFGEDRSTGIYIGTDGIQLGNGFAVDSSGAVRASDLRIIGGAITIGEEGTTVQPVSVGDFTFYNWTCPVNAVHLPYFDYPAGYDVSAVKQNGQIVGSSYYQKFGRSVTLTGDYLESLGTGTYPITVDVVEVHEPPDPFQDDNGVTYYNWSVTRGATSNFPYLDLDSVLTSVNRITAYRGTTSLGLLVAGEDYEVSGHLVKFDGYFETHSFNAGTVLTFKVEGEDIFGFATPNLQIYAPGSSSTITAPNLVITAAEQIKYFEVTNSGAVTATDLTILGGSIRIGNNFVVDASGNLYAETGYFRGGVSAGNVQYGNDDGYFDGYGLTAGSVEGGWGGAIADYTVETDNLVSSITTSLANGESAYDAITNNGYIVVNNVDFRNYPVSWKAVRMADGTTGYAMCR